MITACSYLRMSSDQQGDSISQQRKEVQKFAKDHGYRLVAEYVDEGLSGSKEQEKRVAFQKLLLDSSNGKWSVIVAWDNARFARLDSIDGAFAKQTLRQNGVTLHTVKDGLTDWNTFEGRLKDWVTSEQNHAYSRNLGKDSVRGRLAVLRAGFWACGSVPYGYDRQYHSSGEIIVIAREANYRKARDGKLKLVANDEEAKTIKFIFRQFTEKEASLRGIAMDLNGKGIASPTGKTWTKDTVRDILRRKVYTGVASLGCGRLRQKKVFTRTEPTEVPGACPAIISDEAYQAAQDRLASMKEQGLRQRPTEASPLSSFIVCGHCGFRMRKAKREHWSQAKFICESATKRAGTCHQWAVNESELMALVIGELVKTVDAELLKMSGAKPTEAPTDLAIVQKQVATLDAKYHKIIRRMTDAEDDELYNDLRTEAKRVKAELAGMTERLTILEAMEAQGGVNGFATWWQEIRAKIVFALAPIPWEEDGKPTAITDRSGKLPADLADSLDKPIVFDLDSFRALLRKLGVMVTLFWREIPEAKRVGKKRWELDRGALKIDLTWKPDEDSDKHAKDGSSNRRSHVRSRDTD